MLERLSAALDPAIVSIDLGDLRGYHYHSGAMFAAYCEGFPNAIAQGGRYDEVGLAFGRSRPATGFSLDLREVARLATRDHRPDPIDAPWSDDPALYAAIDALRERGEVVAQRLSSDADAPPEARTMVRVDGRWTVAPPRDAARPAASSAAGPHLSRMVEP